MIWAAILNSRPVRWLGAAAVAVVAFAGIIAHQRKDAAQDAVQELEHEYETETARRVEAGREAVRDSLGDNPSDVLRNNDSAW